jgi:hypothetical protein
MLRASDFISLMRHGLGKTPDPRHNLWQTFNRAGRTLVNMHDWTWRRRGPIDFPVVAETRFFELPLDWGHLISCNVDNTTSANYFRVELASVEFIQQLYQHRLPLGDVGFYIAFPGSQPQRSKDEGPRKVAHFYPEPTEDGNPTLRILYNQAWVEIEENDNDAVPNIPEDFEDTLILMARVKAWRLEYSNPSGEEDLLANELEILRTEDGRFQPNIGHILGGASSRRERIATLRLGIADVSN